MSRKLASVLLVAVAVAALGSALLKRSLQLEPAAQATQVKTTHRKGPRALSPVRSIVPGFRVENAHFEDGRDDLTWFTVVNDTSKDVRAFSIQVDHAGGTFSISRNKADGSVVLPARSELASYIETDNVADNAVIELRAVEFMDGTTLGPARAVELMKGHRRAEP